MACPGLTSYLVASHSCAACGGQELSGVVRAELEVTCMHHMCQYICQPWHRVSHQMAQPTSASCGDTCWTPASGSGLGLDYSTESRRSVPGPSSRAPALPFSRCCPATVTLGYTLHRGTIPNHTIPCHIFPTAPNHAIQHLTTNTLQCHVRTFLYTTHKGHPTTGIKIPTYMAQTTSSRKSQYYPVAH